LYERIITINTNNMETLKAKISDNHDNATFYTGVIAYGKAKNGKAYVLRSENSGEISFNNEHLVGEEIEEKAKALVLTDEDLDEDNNDSDVQILVDGWMVISEAKGTELESILYADDIEEDRIFGYYDEAIEGFKSFLNKE
jgi:hypothetical protein